MNKIRLPGTHVPLSLSVLCGLSLLFAACDSSAIREADKPFETLNPVDMIESMVMTPLSVVENEPQEYLLEMTLRRDEHVDYPDAINLIGYSSDYSGVIVNDSGVESDKTAGDLIFTGIVDKACIPAEFPADSASKGTAVGCEWDVVFPGQECGDFGVCPETARKSYLWGLIEFETNVIVCVCNIKCSFG